MSTEVRLAVLGRRWASESLKRKQCRYLDESPSLHLSFDNQVYALRCTNHLACSPIVGSLVSACTAIGSSAFANRTDNRIIEICVSKVSKVRGDNEKERTNRISPERGEGILGAELLDVETQHRRPYLCEPLNHLYDLLFRDLRTVDLLDCRPANRLQGLPASFELEIAELGAGHRGDVVHDSSDGAEKPLNLLPFDNAMVVEARELERLLVVGLGRDLEREGVARRHGDALGRLLDWPSELAVSLGLFLPLGQALIGDENVEEVGTAGEIANLGELGEGDMLVSSSATIGGGFLSSKVEKGDGRVEEKAGGEDRDAGANHLVGAIDVDVASRAYDTEGDILRQTMMSESDGDGDARGDGGSEAVALGKADEVATPMEDFSRRSRELLAVQRLLRRPVKRSRAGEVRPPEIGGGGGGVRFGEPPGDDGGKVGTRSDGELVAKSAEVRREKLESPSVTVRGTR